MSGAYPSEGFRLALLEPGSERALYDGVAALIELQAAEEGRPKPSGAAARLAQLAAEGSGALVHALLDPSGAVVGYQTANACRTLGGSYVYINETFVPAERRGLGLGFVLMERFVAWAAQRGFTHVYSKTRSADMRRIAERLGGSVKPADWVDIPLGSSASRPA